ncbi:MAG: DNA integrity scanning protein DisA nucleotide-binding domain protein [Armatimonadetes bacterium]|nr:DNA integrity scanning protein DisA nucleotide-binding domain protein [Armatimonadota bacterium]
MDSIDATVDAEGLFAVLDERLEPSVFYVAFRGDEPFGWDAVMTDPKAERGLAETLFPVVAKAPVYYADDPDSGLISMAPEHHRQTQKRVHDKAARRAILEALAPDAASDTKYWVSASARVDEFDIHAVLGLRRSIVEHYAALTTDEVDRFRLPVSLVDAVAEMHLTRSIDALRTDFAFRPRNAELLREAADWLVGGVCPRVNGMAWGAPLSRWLNQLASSPYERRDSTGRLLLARQDHPALRVAVLFRDPVPLHATRAARKMLETAAGEFALLCDGTRAYGLGSAETTPVPGDEPVFSVEFRGQAVWALLAGHAELLRVRFGEPSLPKPLVDMEKIASDLRRIFTLAGSDQVTNICDLVSCAINSATHGALLVVSTIAEDESERLGAQGTRISPAPCGPDLIAAGCAIDGAVLLDQSGVCHAIGVILDGDAVPEGNRGRGARYNSAVRYIARTHELGAAGAAIVISEDGTVDMVPELQPQIGRGVLDDLLGKLSALSAQDDPDGRVMARVIHRLNALRNYLREPLCSEVNALKNTIQERINAQRANVSAATGLGYIIDDYPDFEPCEDVDEGCFR